MWIWRGTNSYEGRLRRDGNKKKKMYEKNKKTENIWTLVSHEFPVNIFILININLRANNNDNNNNTQLSSFHMYPVPWENMYLYSSSIRSNLQLNTPPPSPLLALYTPPSRVYPPLGPSLPIQFFIPLPNLFPLYPYPNFVFEITKEL